MQTSAAAAGVIGLPGAVAGFRLGVGVVATASLLLPGGPDITPADAALQTMGCSNVCRTRQLVATIYDQQGY